VEGVDLEPGEHVGREELAKQEAARKKAEERCHEEGGCGEWIDPECTLKVQIGATVSSTGKEWVYSRGWGSCGKRLLPMYSEIEVCLIAANPEWPENIGSCALAGSGFNPDSGKSGPQVSTLYAHEHFKCESGVTAYYAYGWFWVPGMTKGEEKYSKAWECGASTENTLIEFAISIYEVPVTVSDG
jgi:hypothetical protein